MISIFFKLLKRSIVTLKKEPLLVLPMIIVQLTIGLFTEFGFIPEGGFVFPIIIEWILPMTIIQPICMMLLLQLVGHESSGSIIYNVQRILFLGRGFLLISIYQPIEIFIAYKLGLDLTNQDWLLSQSGIYFVLFGFFTAVLRLCLLYFNYVYSMYAYVNTNLIMLIKVSVRLFLQFKWVTISMIVLYQATSMLVLGACIGLLFDVFPVTYHSIAVSVILSFQVTLFIVVMFRLFLVIKPLTNLNYR